MKIVKTILYILFGLMFINSGLDKFFHYMPTGDLPPDMLELMGHFDALKWIVPLAGFFELLGGVLVLFPKTRFLGALMIFPILIGILLHNITFLPQGLAIVIPLLLIELLIFYDHRSKVNMIMS